MEGPLVFAELERGAARFPRLSKKAQAVARAILVDSQPEHQRFRGMLRHHSTELPFLGTTDLRRVRAARADIGGCNASANADEESHRHGGGRACQMEDSPRGRSKGNDASAATRGH